MTTTPWPALTTRCWSGTSCASRPLPGWPTKHLTRCSARASSCTWASMRPSDSSPRSRASAWVPEVAGILTADQVISTGHAIAAVQQPGGAIGWPDGHVDAWNHVECAMALSVCGLRAAARRAYEWLRAAQRPDGSWPKVAGDGTVLDEAVESNHAAYCAVGVLHELQITRD